MNKNIETSLVKKIDQMVTSTEVKFACITEDKLADINSKMAVIKRATQSFGKRNTQTTSKLMTLNMLACSPYRALRQCLAQIEKKRIAIKESIFKIKETEIEIKDFIKSGTELDLLKAERAKSGISDSVLYLEGALKELAGFQDAYEQIRVSNNIRENWDEKDFEESEPRHHVMSTFRNGIRDMLAAGNLGHGTAEYMEQFGIHPVRAMKEISAYIKKCAQNGNDNYTDYVKFLNEMADKYSENYKEAMKRLGLTNLLTESFLYKEE
tara:strand:+ start:2554 stop:3354 length:801 start_codon:yes stop_codon:yes gene_type:complete